MNANKGTSVWLVAGFGESDRAAGRSGYRKACLQLARHPAANWDRSPRVESLIDDFALKDSAPFDLILETPNEISIWPAGTDTYQDENPRVCFSVHDGLLLAQQCQRIER
jgi:hypothetical protein